MKKTILLTALTTLSLMSHASRYDYDLDKFTPLKNIDDIELALEKGLITDDQYENLLMIQESGGEILSTDINPELDTIAAEDIKFKSSEEQNIDGVVTIPEIQKKSINIVAGHGDWGFDFLYLDKNSGQIKNLSSFNTTKTTRPGSTMKLFTSWAAYNRNSYNLSLMEKMLRISHNTMADNALKSVANTEKNYAIPADSYLNQIIGHKMYDTLAGKVWQVIDKTIAKGCGVLINDYKNLESANLFHPVNGSGLQHTGLDKDVHTNKVTPRLETQLLLRILKSPKYNAFKAMLPSPGTSGTLRAKFPTLRKYAKIFAKTGTLGTGKALAGFIETKKGYIIFSVIGDNIRGVKNMKQAHDAIIEPVVYANTKYIIDRGL